MLYDEIVFSIFTRQESAFARSGFYITPYTYLFLKYLV